MRRKRVCRGCEAESSGAPLQFVCSVGANAAKSSPLRPRPDSSSRVGSKNTKESINGSIPVYLGIVLLTTGSALAANAQIETAYPTDDEIGLVLTQTERAIQQYKPLIDQEEIQMGRAQQTR